MATAAGAASRQTASSTASSPSTRVADTTSRVAQSRMEEAASASGAPLTGAPSGSYDFDNELTNAEDMRLADSKGAAFGHFDVIDGYLERTTLPPTSFFPARCLLGLADCSDPGDDRTHYAMQAYQALNLVYDHRNDWSPEEASPAYSELRWLLTKFILLIGVEHPLASTEIARKIVECQKHILPIDDFKEKVKEGDDYFKAQETLAARECYKAALLLYQNRNEIEFIVARVHCLLQLTSTYEQAEPERAHYRDQAQDAIFMLYSSSTALFMKDGLSGDGLYTRGDAYKLLLGHLRALGELTPAIEEHERNLNEILWRINDCKTEIPDEVNNIRLRREPPPADHFGPSGRGSAPPPGSPPRRVSPGSPDGSCNLCRLLIACVFIAALAAVGVAIYRRYNVKVS